jgi:hypothetical protein
MSLLPSVAPFETICKVFDFSNLRLLFESSNYFCNIGRGIREVSQKHSIQYIITKSNGNVQIFF